MHNNDDGPQGFQIDDILQTESMISDDEKVDNTETKITQKSHIKENMQEIKPVQIKNTMQQLKLQIEAQIYMIIKNFKKSKGRQKREKLRKEQT